MYKYIQNYDIGMEVVLSINTSNVISTHSKRVFLVQLGIWVLDFEGLFSFVSPGFQHPSTASVMEVDWES